MTSKELVEEIGNLLKSMPQDDDDLREAFDIQYDSLVNSIIAKGYTKETAKHLISALGACIKEKQK